MKEVRISLNYIRFCKCLKELRIFKVCNQCTQFFLRFPDSPFEFFCFKAGPTSEGTHLTGFLQPTDRLHDFPLACRADNFEGHLIK